MFMNQGTRMHATVTMPQDMRRFKRALFLGDWKVITNFVVVYDHSPQRLTQMERKIRFTEETQIMDASNIYEPIRLDIVRFEDVWRGNVVGGSSYPRGDFFLPNYVMKRAFLIL